MGAGRGHGWRKPRLAAKDEDDQPPRVADVELATLGVHWSAVAGRTAVPYVGRDTDPDLRAALAAGSKVVLVAGPRLCGATRSLAEGLRAVLPDAQLVAFHQASRRSIAEQVEEARRWLPKSGEVVLWLDGIQWPTLRELTPTRVRTLPAGLRIVGTVRGADTESLGYDVANLTHARAIHLVRLGPVTDRERRRLPADVDGPLGRSYVPLDPAERALSGDDPAGADRAALIRVAVDWHRIGVRLPLTESVLGELVPRYLDGPVSPARFRRAFNAALAPQPSGDPPLLARLGAGRHADHLPHPVLTAAADSPDFPLAGPVHAGLWAHLDHVLRGEARLVAGLVAVDRGEYAAASRLLADEPEPPVSPTTMVRLGAAEFECSADGTEVARTWWQHALESGDPDAVPDAMANLGVLEAHAGHTDEARDWLGRAVLARHPTVTPHAMLELGLVEEQAGNLDDAITLYVRAVESRHPDASPTGMVYLGSLHDQRLGAVEEARRWFTRAVRTGHPDVAPNAMLDLGILEAAQGNTDEARQWFARALRSGHVDAAPSGLVNLGILHERLGDPTEARRWYLRAVAAEHPDVSPKAMINLAGVADEPSEARQWYARAVASGHPDAAARATDGLAALRARDRQLH